jgi:predicted nuclease of predicted toxin-antitoxin system
MSPSTRAQAARGRRAFPSRIRPSAGAPRSSGFEEEGQRLSYQFKLLIDENLSPKLARYARERGFHAVHVNEVNLRTAADKYIARYAVDNGMVLVTNNMADFSLLYARRKLHPGLIFLQCAAPEIFTEANQATLLGIALDNMLQNDLVQEAIRINLIEVVGGELVWQLTRRLLPDN